MCLTSRTTEKDPRQGSPLSAWMGRATDKDWPEAFWLPATKGSKKDSERTITPAREAVHVPAHLVPPGSPQAKQLHLTSHWWAAMGKKSLASMRTGSLQSCLDSLTLYTVACQASLSGSGALQARILEHIDQYRLPYPFRALYFLLP